MRMSEETFNFRLHKAWHCLVGWVLVMHWSPRVSIFGVFLSPDILPGPGLQILRGGTKVGLEKDHLVSASGAVNGTLQCIFYP